MTAVAVVTLVAGAGASAATAQGAAGPTPPTWSSQALPGDYPPPSPGSSLSAISCPANGECVAVGNDQIPGENPFALIETLSNGAWTGSIAPNPPGTINTASLSGVSCVTETSCVAVGSYQPDGDGDQPLVETLSDGTWTAVAPPPGPTESGILSAVSCPTDASCVAVGMAQESNGDSTGPLVENLSAGNGGRVIRPRPPERRAGSMVCRAPPRHVLWRRCLFSRQPGGAVRDSQRRDLDGCQRAAARRGRVELGPGRGVMREHLRRCGLLHRRVGCGPAAGGDSHRGRMGTIHALRLRPRSHRDFLCLFEVPGGRKRP